MRVSIRKSAALWIAVTALAGLSPFVSGQRSADPAKYLFVWAGDEDRKPTVKRAFGSLESLTFLHSFARLPNGHVLAIFQGHGPQNAAPGRPPGSVFAR